MGDDAAPASGAAAFEHLIGPCHGTVTWLHESTADIFQGADRLLRVSETHPGEPHSDLIARLHPAENSFEIEATDSRPIWVNGLPVTGHRLEHGDMVEFGDTGPLSRFCLYRSDRSVRKSVAEILSDTVGYLRVSRQPFVRRLFRAFGGSLRRLMRETTILFRTTVIFAILALAALSYQQYRLNTLLRLQFETDISRLDGIAGALIRAKDQTLTPDDLETLRQEIRGRLSSNADRLAALE